MSFSQPVRIFVLPIMLLLTTCDKTVSDQTESSHSVTFDLSRREQVLASRSPNRFRETMYRWFDEYGVDGAIEEDWLEDAIKVELAEVRQRLIHAILFKNDLDLNGGLSAEESANHGSDFGQFGSQFFSSFESAFLELDLNGDGNLPAAELHLGMTQALNSRRSSNNVRWNYASYIMPFDLNRDGKVTIPEFETGFDAWLAENPPPDEAEPEPPVRPYVARPSTTQRRELPIWPPTNPEPESPLADQPFEMITPTYEFQMPGVWKLQLEQVDPFYLEIMREQFDQLFEDGVASQSLIIFARDEALHKSRLRKFSDLMKWDLDGDQIISSDEAETSIGVVWRRSSSAAKSLLDKLAAVDLDRDGTIRPMEIRKLIEQSLRELRPHQNYIRHFAYGMTFDSNGNDELTWDEFEAGFRAINQHQVRSGAAIGRLPYPLRNKSGEGTADILAPRRDCDVPSPTEQAELIVVDSGRRALTNVHLGDARAEVAVSTVFVESGERPIYLVARNRHHTIWDLEGSTERVEAFVAQFPMGIVGEMSRAPAGVSGLHREQIHFIDNLPCFTETLESINWPTDFKTDGRSVGFAAGGLTSVPSGHTPLAWRQYRLDRLAERMEGRMTARAGFPDILFQRFWRQYAYGVREFNLASVTAPYAADYYDILPGRAGVIELIDEGVLKFEENRLIVESTPSTWPEVNLSDALYLELPDDIPMPSSDEIAMTSVQKPSTGECWYHGRPCSE